VTFPSGKYFSVRIFLIPFRLFSVLILYHQTFIFQCAGSAILMHRAKKKAIHEKIMAE